MENKGKKEEFTILQKILGILIPITGLFFILDIPFHIAKITLFNQQYIATFWALVTALVFITYPASRKSPKNNPQWYDFLLASLVLIVGFYTAINYPKILMGMGLVKTIEVVFGVLATMLIIESVRRTAGLAVVAIILVFLIYAKFGYLIDGTLGTGHIKWNRLFQQLYLGADFMLGIPLKVVCQVVFGFILFGVVYLKLGGGDILMDLASSLMGGVRGGPAKVAVIASSLFGSISGSAVANVSATGMITIPLMKNTGYSAYYAGAVEAVASTGGQIMPPVMGAAAFVMAEFLGIPYFQVVIVAIVPALLYYLGLFIQIDLQAVKCGLKGLPQEQIPSFRKIIKKGWPYLLPMITLIYTLFFLFWPPGQAAVSGAVTAIIISFLKKDTRILWNKSKLFDIFMSISRAMFEVVTVCAGAGLIIGLVGYTGLGLSFSQLLTQAAGGNLLILAFYTAIASTILGMGMPTTAAYIMLAVLAAPAMVSLGIRPLTAHLFVFYFGTLSMLTPPVCLSVFAAASIANAPTGKIALQAVKLAIAGYVVPFVFLFNPGVVLVGSPLEIALSIFFIIIVISLFAISFEGYFLSKLGWWQRILFLIGSIAIAIPNFSLRLFGLLIVSVSLLYEYYRNNSK